MAYVDPDVADVWEDFHELVNMSSPELRDWLLTGAGVVVPTRLDRAGWLAAPFPGRGVVLRRSPPGMCGRLGGAPVVVVYRTGGATGRVRRFLPLVVDPHDVLLYRSRLGVGC